ncbi:MAG: VOC family protein [Sphingomonas sp.]|nr:VOC family protein [Sphingomonas sp.]
MTRAFSHAMMRVHDLETTKRFFVDGLGLVEKGTYVNDKGGYTMAVLNVVGDDNFEVHLTYNHDGERYVGGRSFGHLAFVVDNIYDTCNRILDLGFTVARPPRDGRMAFLRTPEGISIELVQDGAKLAISEPWASMPNDGSW